MNKRQFLLPLAVSISALITGADTSLASPAPSISLRAELGQSGSSETIQDPLVLKRATGPEARFADHESHSSHESHASHSSHSSGS
jgi:hypothetical protein